MLSNKTDLILYLIWFITAMLVIEKLSMFIGAYYPRNQWVIQELIYTYSVIIREVVVTPLS